MCVGGKFHEPTLPAELRRVPQNALREMGRNATHRDRQTGGLTDRRTDTHSPSRLGSAPARDSPNRRAAPRLELAQKLGEEGREARETKGGRREPGLAGVRRRRERGEGRRGEGKGREWKEAPRSRLRSSIGGPPAWPGSGGAARASYLPGLAVPFRPVPLWTLRARRWQPSPGGKEQWIRSRSRS